MSKASFTVLLEWDSEEKLYIATIPALSIGSYGATRQEAMDMIRQAAVVTIEGLKATGQVVPLDDEGPVGHVEVMV